MDMVKQYLIPQTQAQTQAASVASNYAKTGERLSVVFLFQFKHIAI